MWNFIKSLLSNRFGIVLGTLNVCYLFHVYRTFHPGVPEVNYHQLAMSLNSPALIFSSVSQYLIDSGFHLYTNQVTHLKFELMFLPLFVFVQWLIIGWFAKTLAQKVSKR